MGEMVKRFLSPGGGLKGGTYLIVLQNRWRRSLS
jgi:hypothetical protein